MAQGNHKLGKSVKSAGSQKHKSVKAGTRKAKGGSFIERNKCIADASKAINKKNERMIAGKASNAGANFFLKDISTKGKQEATRKNAERNKKEKKEKKLSARLGVQLQKLGK